MNVTIFKSIVLGLLIFASFSLTSFKSNATELESTIKGLSASALNQV